MNIFQQYGIKEVADVCFYSIEEDENDDEVYVPVLYLDTLKVSTIEQTSSDTAARGGLGNPKLIVWDFGKEITLTLEDALYSPASMAMIWGSKLKTKPFTLNGYITHYIALNLDEYYDIDKYRTAIDGGVLREDEPPHTKGEDDLENLLDDTGNLLNASYDMNGNNLTDARLTITKFGNFEMSPNIAINNTKSLTAFCWQDCEGYIKSKNNKYQYSFKHCKLCYLCNENWETGLRGRWIIKFDDKENMHDGYAESLLHSDIVQFHMTSYDTLTGQPERIICNFFPDDLFIQSGWTDTDYDTYLPIKAIKGQPLSDEQINLNKSRRSYINSIKKYGLTGFNNEGIMYTSSTEYIDDTFLNQTNVSVNDWKLSLLDRNESIIPPQECIYQIDSALDSVFYLDRIEKCKATQTFAIDTNLNQLEDQWRYLPAYQQTQLTVYIDPKTMRPYEPNTNVFYRRNGDAWYGYDLIDIKNDTSTKDKIDDYHYNYQLELKQYQDEDAPYNIKVFKQYEIYYKWTRTRAAENTSLGKRIIVDAEHFPGTYRIVGECCSRSRETGKDEKFQFEIPLAKVKANQESINLQADGDPTTFTMSIDVLRPENGEMMKLTQYNVVQSEYPLDFVNDPRKKQKSGATEIVNEDLIDPEDPFEKSNLNDNGTGDNGHRTPNTKKATFEWQITQAAKTNKIYIGTTQTIDSTSTVPSTTGGTTTTTTINAYGPWIVDNTREDILTSVDDNHLYKDNSVMGANKILSAKLASAPSAITKNKVENTFSNSPETSNFSQGQIAKIEISGIDYYGYLTQVDAITKPKDKDNFVLIDNSENKNSTIKQVKVNNNNAVIDVLNIVSSLPTLPTSNGKTNYAGLFPLPMFHYIYGGKEEGTVQGKYTIPAIRYKLRNYKGIDITTGRKTTNQVRPAMDIMLQYIDEIIPEEQSYICQTEGYYDGIWYNVGDEMKSVGKKSTGTTHYVNPIYIITQSTPSEEGATFTKITDNIDDSIVVPTNKNITFNTKFGSFTCPASKIRDEASYYEKSISTDDQTRYWIGAYRVSASKEVWDNYLSQMTDYTDMSYGTTVSNEDKEFEYSEPDSTITNTVGKSILSSNNKYDKTVAYTNSFESKDWSITSNPSLKFEKPTKISDATTISILENGGDKS